MYAYPFYPSRSVHSLDGIWEFAFLGADAPKLEEIRTDGIRFNELMAVIRPEAAFFGKTIN